MLDSASRDRLSRTLARPRLADALDRLQVVDRGGEQLLQPAEVVDQPVDHRAGQPRHLRQQPVAPRADRGLQRLRGGRVAGGPGDLAEVEQLGGGQRGQLGERLLRRPGAPVAGQVVPGDQLPLRLHAGEQLVQLQGQQPAVGAELDDVALDLVRDPAHHLQPLGDAHRVPDGDQVLDLQRGQRAGDLVQPHLVALQGGQRLVGPGQDGGGVVQHVAPAVDVQPDHPHRLADRDHREAGLRGHPLRGAVPGAGLLGRDRRVGHQLHGGADDPGAVGGQHHRAVHLGQLAHPGGGELDVQREAAGADRLHDPVVAQHDQRAGVAAEDALQTVPQAGPGRDHGERRTQLVLAVRHRHLLPPGRRSPPVYGRRADRVAGWTPDVRTRVREPYRPGRTRTGVSIPTVTGRPRSRRTPSALLGRSRLRFR